MKKILLPLLLLACVVRLPAQTLLGQVTLNFYLGVLSDSSGTPIADGSMLQIIASDSGTSLAPATSTDFLGGDTGATILWEGGFDSSTSGLAGAASLTLQIPIYAGANEVTTGSTLFVRWYPDVAGSSATPGATAYGQYGYASATGTVLDTSWVVPSAGASTDYFLLTTSVGGTLDDTVGQATNVTAVPEPATTATILGGLGLALGWYLRRKRQS